MKSVKTEWTIPVESIKTVKCIYCDESGNVEWAGLHLAKKQYWKLPMAEQKNKRGYQFVVIERQ